MAPDLHVRSDRRVGSDAAALANLRRGMDERRRVNLGLHRHQPEQKLTLGDELLTDIRRRLSTRQRRSSASGMSLNTGSVYQNGRAILGVGQGRADCQGACARMER